MNYFVELLFPPLIIYFTSNSQPFQKPKLLFVLWIVENTAVSGEYGDEEVLFLILKKKKADVIKTVKNPFSQEMTV